MFKVIIDKYDPVAIYFIVLGSNLYTDFVFPVWRISFSVSKAFHCQLSRALCTERETLRPFLTLRMGYISARLHVRQTLISILT